MDWHRINFKRGVPQETAAADLVLALEDAYDSAGEPADAEVFLSREELGRYAFYLSPEAAHMAPGVLQRFGAVLCEPPPHLHRCTPLLL